MNWLKQSLHHLLLSCFYINFSIHRHKTLPGAEASASVISRDQMQTPPWNRFVIQPNKTFSIYIFVHLNKTRFEFCSPVVHHIKRDHFHRLNRWTKQVNKTHFGKVRRGVNSPGRKRFEAREVNSELVHFTRRRLRLHSYFHTRKHHRSRVFLRKSMRFC